MKKQNKNIMSRIACPPPATKYLCQTAPTGHVSIVTSVQQCYPGIDDGIAPSAARFPLEALDGERTP